MKASAHREACRRTPCSVLALVGLGLTAIVLTGCGYSTSSLIRDDIRTVHVPVFDNQTWRRGLEVDLTRAIVEELKLHTHLRIAPKDEADSTLEGELVEFTQSVVTKSVDDQVLLKRAQATVRYKWKDNLTKRDIVPSRSVMETETVALARADPVETWLFRKLAQRIVESLEQQW